MHIVVIGVDHTTAPIALRERLACSNRQIPQVLQSVRQVAQESVLLSTCNRVELYAVCQEAGQGFLDLLALLSEIHQVAIEELKAHSYCLQDEQAVSHLFGVACGLYSLVPGEPQIQGQVATALDIAQGGGYAGPITSALFRAALVTGKRARSETGISRNAASVSHNAVQVAQVQALIDVEVERFERWLASLSVVDTISDLRHHVDQLRQQELTRTLRQLSPTLSEREIAVVQELTNRLTNKLLHIPTLRLKDAAAAGQGHIYAEAMRYLFGLEENIDANQDRNASQQACHETNELGCAAITSAMAQS